MRAIWLVLAALWASSGIAADPPSFLDQAIGSAAPDYPVYKYIICTVHAQTGGVAMAGLDRDRARPYFKEAIACLDEKFPAALAEAEGNADLTAALKEHFVQSKVWASAMAAPATKPPFEAAYQRVKMEATLAKKWKPST